MADDGGYEHPECRELKCTENTIETKEGICSECPAYTKPNTDRSECLKP
jgi:hypothetical protein